MRSNSVKLRFADYTGTELRTSRRYSRANIPYLDSLKQLFVLFNWLSPQVFRPVDFIILSLFETAKPFLSPTTRKELTTCEINYLLCVILVHVYLLLTNSTEDQILRRLHYLSPQVIESYSENGYLSPNTSFSRPRGTSGNESINKNKPPQTTTDPNTSKVSRIISFINQTTSNN